MTDQMEAELRDAFALRAAEVPAGATERLRQVDYKPRTRRRWPRTIGAVGGTFGAGAVVSVIVLGGSQSAFAGWSPTPATPTAAQRAATQDNCQGYLSTMPGGTDPGSWSQVATDVRGPYSVAIFENGSGFATCFTGPSFTVASFSLASGQLATSASGPGTEGASSPSSTSTGVRSPGGGIDLISVSHLSLTGNGPYTLAEGRLDAAVSAVTLVLGDGQDVTATTVPGWFVAWWPGNQNVTAAQITSASGTTTEPVQVPTSTLPRLPPTAPPGSARPSAPLTGGPDGLPGGGAAVHVDGGPNNPGSGAASVNSATGG